MNKDTFYDLVMGFEDDRPEWLRNMVSRSYWLYYKAFTALAKHMNPELIVELGTQAGTGALHFRHGSPTARIVTVDIKKTLPKWCNQLREQRIEYIISDAAKAASLVDGDIDIIFYDANHEYENVIAEVAAWMPRVKEGGIAMFDDIHYDIEKRKHGHYLSKHNKLLATGEETGMSRAWKEVSEQYGKEAFEFEELHPGVSFGVILF